MIKTKHPTQSPMKRKIDMKKKKEPRKICFIKLMCIFTMIIVVDKKKNDAYA